MANQVEMLSMIEALVRPPGPQRLRVGVALPMSGLLAQVGPSALDAVILAGTELAASRSASERHIEFVCVDAGAAPQEVGRSVLSVVRDGGVEAVVGLHTSDVRDAVEATLGEFRVPYVFTPGHEDTRRPEGFYCSGESPGQLVSGLSSVIRDRGVFEWALVGSDYVWPRAIRTAARSVIEANDGCVVLDRLFPLGRVKQSMRELVGDLKACGAGGVVLSMPSRELTQTLTALRSAGLDKRLVRYSGCLEENALYAIDGDRSGNLYSALHSFENLTSARRTELNGRYVAAFGDDSPVLNSWAEHCYDAVQMIGGLERAGLLELASFGSADSLATAAAAHRPEYEMHLAVASGLAFEVL